MKLHPILANVFLPLMVAALAIWLVVEHQARLRLTSEHQALAQQYQQMVDLAARNEQLSNLVAQASAAKPLTADEQMELLRLRGEVGMLRREKPDFDQAREENHRIHDVLDRYRLMLAGTNGATTNFWPQGSWANAGYGTPEAGLQTLLWAGYNGDLTNFTASIATEGDTNFFGGFAQGKSAAEQSIRLADEVSGLKSLQILNRETVDNNTVLLTVEVEVQNDFQAIKMVMKNDGGQWKLAGPEGVP